ncbi:MAG: amidohydrolase, partial [Acidimicrobiia bacterium]
MDADDLVLISVDDHVIEPRDMFDAHVPVRWRDAAPRVHEDRHGREYWWYGDMRGRTMGLNATAGRPLAEYAWDAYRYDEMRPGCYDPAARVADMDTGGVLASLNFPNFPGFAGQ